MPLHTWTSILRECILIEKAGIKSSEAEKYIKQVKKAISEWHAFAEEAGLSLKNMERIEKFFDV